MMLNAQSDFKTKLYCLVYGQMSHWGDLHASNVIIIIILILLYQLCFIKGFSFLLDPFILNLKLNANEGLYKIIKHCEKRSEVTNFTEPLNNEILSIIYGSLLGDASAEKRKGGKGTRIVFYQESSHVEYLLYLHRLVANLGYCNTNIPKITTRLGKNGKIRQIVRFSTWTYDQFNDIQAEWYNNNIKFVPQSIENYLTPLALAIWIMDDGGKVGSGLKLATNSFKYDDLLYLIKIFKDKYNLDATIQKTGVIDQYHIYISAHSMLDLVNIVKPYIIPSMKYKFGKYID